MTEHFKLLLIYRKSLWPALSIFQQCSILFYMIFWSSILVKNPIICSNFICIATVILYLEESVLLLFAIHEELLSVCSKAGSFYLFVWVWHILLKRWTVPASFTLDIFHTSFFLIYRLFWKHHLNLKKNLQFNANFLKLVWYFKYCFQKMCLSEFTWNYFKSKYLRKWLTLRTYILAFFSI